jgi:hypothetical protein
VRAISRGTNPDQEMPAGTIKGLQGDGLSIGNKSPGNCPRLIMLGRFGSLPSASCRQSLPMLFL